MAEKGVDSTKKHYWNNYKKIETLKSWKIETDIFPFIHVSMFQYSYNIHLHFVLEYNDKDKYIRCGKTPSIHQRT